jgi:hypothetical protein
MNKKQIFYRLFKLAYTNGWEPQNEGINKMLSNLESEIESFLIFNEDGTIDFKGKSISLIEALTDFELDRQCALYYLIKKESLDMMFLFKKNLISTPKSEQLDLFLYAFKHLLTK